MEKCRICGWQGEAEYLTIREMMYGDRDEFIYFLCPECNCLQIQRVPDNLDKYYRKNYYSYSMPDMSEILVKERDKTRVLDVGCGAGAWLCELAGMGYCNLAGCDPFIEKDLEYDNGVKIYKKTIHEMEGKYDWIFLMDSFEHMTDPHEVMDSIRCLLAPDGIVKLSLPVFPNIAYNLFGENWFQLDAPRHIFLHSRQSLEYLTVRHGLKISHIEYDCLNGAVIRSFLYAKGIPYQEQTIDIIMQYFDEEAIVKINEQVALANKRGDGDHAIFYLVHSNRADRLN